MSLSARRAWIEIFVPFDVIRPAIVALRKESVDRNDDIPGATCRILRSLSARRAWIEITTPTRTLTGCASLSARRAWIEMSVVLYSVSLPSVALRKESVDRNIKEKTQRADIDASLSARRAWIEI